MGVPPPLGRGQEKRYSVIGLPGNLDPNIPEHKEIICQYQEEYRAYVTARESLGRTMQGQFFRVTFEANDTEGAEIDCPKPAAKAKAKAMAYGTPKAKAASKKRVTKKQPAKPPRSSGKKSSRSR